MNRNDTQEPKKEKEGRVNLRKDYDCPNHSTAEIDEDTEKSPGELGRLESIELVKISSWMWKTRMV